jgi:perosamine synthetase
MIPLFKVYMAEEVDKPLLRTLHSGYIGQGTKVEEFEAALRKKLDFENVLTVNSGTSALQLALRVAGVGYVNGGSTEDEVITTPMTCTATNMPILAAGANIVWADIYPNVGLIDPLDVERKITDRTKAIICVDWGGLACDIDRLKRIVEGTGISIIEDGAHAFGSKDSKGRWIGGGQADYTCFSFQAIKHLTTVDGGAISVRDSESYRRAKLIRWYGIDRETDRKDFRCEEDIEEWGLKWHMNDVAATIGYEQLKHHQKIVHWHRANARHIYEGTEHRSIVPAFSQEALDESAFWLYTVLLPHAGLRQAFMEHMKDREIETSRVHARNDTHTCFSAYREGRLPGVDEFSSRMCCVPVHWGLDRDDLDKIAGAINDFQEQTWMIG